MKWELLLLYKTCKKYIQLVLQFFQIVAFHYKEKKVLLIKHASSLYCFVNFLGEGEPEMREKEAAAATTQIQLKEVKSSKTVYMQNLKEEKTIAYISFNICMTFTRSKIRQSVPNQYKSVSMSWLHASRVDKEDHSPIRN